jgi:hypothetical protein
VTDELKEKLDRGESIAYKISFDFENESTSELVHYAAKIGLIDVDLWKE